jgi:hypothetical protein
MEPYQLFKEAFAEAELSRLKAKETAGGGKLEGEDRKKRLIVDCFDMMFHILDLPIPTTLLQLKAIELLGDLLAEYHDYRLALLYYLKGVLCSFIGIEVVCGKTSALLREVDVL